MPDYINRSSEGEARSQQMRALIFFESNKNYFPRFTIFNEGGFAAEWYDHKGHFGWMDAKGSDGKYRLKDTPETVKGLLVGLAIDSQNVIMM